MIIRFNCYITCIRFKNVRKPLPTTDLDITNIIYILLFSYRLFYFQHIISICQYHFCKFSCNTINRITIIFTSLLLQNAGNINNRFFFLSIFIIIIMKFLFIMIIQIISFILIISFIQIIPNISIIALDRLDFFHVYKGFVSAFLFRQFRIESSLIDISSLSSFIN